jgi:hypothetical protein
MSPNISQNFKKRKKYIFSLSLLSKCVHLCVPRCSRMDILCDVLLHDLLGYDDVIDFILGCNKVVGHWMSLLFLAQILLTIPTNGNKKITLLQNITPFSLVTNRSGYNAALLFRVYNQFYNLKEAACPPKSDYNFYHNLMPRHGRQYS